MPTCDAGREPALWPSRTFRLLVGTPGGGLLVPLSLDHLPTVKARGTLICRVFEVNFRRDESATREIHGYL